MASAINCIVSYFNKKKRIDTFQTPRVSDEESLLREESDLRNSGLTRVFTFEDLREATNNFSTKLGDGGYGIVYLGELRDKRMVAVKELIERNRKQREDLIKEVKLLSCLSHRNIITLYGFTNRDNQLLLVYEFVPNDTVFEHLHVKVQPLAWNVRVRIAVETAEALSYLHSHDPQIVHRDVKPQNILLNHDFSVKVADFGLCRVLPPNTQVTTVTSGTVGYQDPEYKSVFKLTDKSDVYSFGVVLMELISRKKAVDIDRGPDNIYLVDNIHLDIFGVKIIIKKKLKQLIDPALGYQSNSEVRMMVDRVAHLALECLQQTGKRRPTMAVVLKALKSIRNQMTERPGVDNGHEEVYRQIWSDHLRLAIGSQPANQTQN